MRHSQNLNIVCNPADFLKPMLFNNHKIYQIIWHNEMKNVCGVFGI